MSKIPDSTANALAERARKKVLAEIDARLVSNQATLINSILQIDPFLPSVEIERQAFVIVRNSL